MVQYCATIPPDGPQMVEDQCFPDKNSNLLFKNYLWYNTVQPSPPMVLKWLKTNASLIKNYNLLFKNHIWYNTVQPSTPHGPQMIEDHCFLDKNSKLLFKNHIWYNTVQPSLPMVLKWLKTTASLIQIQNFSSRTKYGTILCNHPTRWSSNG